MKIEGLQIQGTLCPVFGKQAVTEDKRVEMMGAEESDLRIDSEKSRG